VCIEVWIEVVVRLLILRELTITVEKFLFISGNAKPDITALKYNPATDLFDSNEHICKIFKKGNCNRGLGIDTN